MFNYKMKHDRSFLKNGSHFTVSSVGVHSELQLTKIVDIFKRIEQKYTQNLFLNRCDRQKVQNVTKTSFPNAALNELDGRKHCGKRRNCSFMCIFSQ